VASTFAIHADRLDVVAAAEAAGVDRATVLDTIERLDTAVAEIDGHGFAPTPFGPQSALADSIASGEPRTTTRPASASPSRRSPKPRKSAAVVPRTWSRRPWR